MKKSINAWGLALLAAPLSMSVMAGMEDDPTLVMVKIDKAEYRFTNGDNPVIWDAEAWIGKDLNKLWFKTEGEVVGGTTESAWAEMLYSRAIAPYWDLQAGWRHDFRPGKGKDWAAFGIKGLAPYFFEVDATAYARPDGDLAARLNVEYEFMFTQRLILSPEIEANFFSRSNEQRGVGSGLSDMELGLRLRYEIRREFAPYIGVNWEKAFGDTANFRRDEGGSASDLQFVVGIRAWY